MSFHVFSKLSTTTLSIRWLPKRHFIVARDPHFLEPQLRGISFIHLWLSACNQLPNDPQGNSINMWHVGMSATVHWGHRSNPPAISIFPPSCWEQNSKRFGLHRTAKKVLPKMKESRAISVSVPTISETYSGWQATQHRKPLECCKQEKSV